MLGPLEARGETGPVPVAGAKARALLAVLLLQPNRMIARERLIDELWGDAPPETAVKAVQVYISQLRRLLPEGLLVTFSPGYMLELDPELVDAHRFARLVADAREARPAEAVEMLREALDLWRGPALAEFTDEAGLRTEAARLEEARLVAIERRLEAELALGRHSDVVGDLEALVAQHPQRERFRQQMMLALYRVGRHADALEAFRAARAALKELGLQPSAELRDLEKRILTQDSTLDLKAEMPSHAQVGAPRAAPTRRSSIGIIVAEDNLLVREGLAHLIELRDGFTVVDTCGDLDGVLQAVEAKAPAVVVTDIRMPPGYSDEGIRIANLLRETHPGIGVVVVSEHADPAYALALLERGSERRAYLLKDRIHRFEELENAIHAVAAGESVIDPKVVEALVSRNRGDDSPLGRLTPRELETLELMAQGKNNAGIARVLGLTEPSVAKHVAAVLQKLDLGDVADVHRRVKAVLVYLSHR